LSEKHIRKILTDYGLTEKETEVYILLAKSAALKIAEISKFLKKDKAQIFRILKNLQTKGLVEPTLEFPKRYTAVSFEAVLDNSIKSKREDASFIENAKKDLLDYLKKTRQAELEPSLERFLIIEGTEKIYLKATQMLKEAKRSSCAIIKTSEILRTKQFSFFETSLDNALKNKIEFRLLTEGQNQDLLKLKKLLNRTRKTGVTFESRSPELGLKLAPQMLTKDGDEALFFIKPTADNLQTEKEVCLWTNCKPLVYAFNSVFENLWRNSADLLTRIREIEIGRLEPEMQIIKDAEIAQEKYINVLNSARKEIIIMTSSEGVFSNWRNMPLLKEQAARGVLTKIMVPVTSANLSAVQELSQFCILKHVSDCYLGTTIVDEKHLFQFKEPEYADSSIGGYFENICYTDDLDYVSKAKNMLYDIWENAAQPSSIPLGSIIEDVKSEFIPFPNVPLSYIKKLGATNIIEEKLMGVVSEKNISDEIMNVKKTPKQELSGKVIDRMYSSIGLAVVHPPEDFNLPDMMIVAHKIDKQSGFGEEDAMLIFLWLDTPKGFTYVPVAVVGDNPRSHNFWKSCLAGTFAGKNAQLIKKDEIEVRVHGNSLFVGWTVPIPLLLPKYVLPPACILIEGYGDVKTAAYTIAMPLGDKYIEQNYFEAFVTFMHPSSKYSGPGTDGFFIRDSISTLYSRQR
jgi:sugar-specific transcriptional regulator TrmB